MSHQYPLRLARASSHRAAGACLLLLAALLIAWTVVGWVHVGQFNGAAGRLFDGPDFADDDYASAYVEYAYAGRLLAADALAIITLIIGWAALRQWRRARTATVVLGIALLAFSVKVFLLGFIAGIQVPTIGISAGLFRASATRFNQLTPWRLTAWFHAVTLTTGVLVIVGIVASWYLLRDE
jgi:hypothetical protein